MSEARCERTELLVSACGHCRSAADPRVPVMTVIAANYNGHCAACDELVEAGDAIGHSTDGWVGMRCCGIRA